MLPQRYNKATTAQLPAGQLRQTTVRYLEEFFKVAPEGVGCLFVGKARTWKTYAASAILRRVHEHTGLSCIFVQGAILANQVDRNRFSASTDLFVQRAKAAHLVLLDDFAQIPERSPAAQTLVEIAEARFSDQLPTLWTANIEAPATGIVKAIGQLYGAGFARRVYDSSEGFRVHTT